MRIVQWGAILLCAGLSLAVVLALFGGDLVGQARRILSQPWGIVSLLDVGVGLLLLRCWIIFRERSLPRAALWLIAMLILGNIASTLYIALAAHNSHGDWQRFFLSASRSLATR